MTLDASRTLVVLQPGYLPWLGYFDQMYRATHFVHYDDVQFDKHGWRNRNRVKAPTGQPHWLTVPVRHTGLGFPRIADVDIDRRMPWARKHIGTLRQFYRAAPYATTYLPALEAVLTRDWYRLIDLDLAVIELVCGWLGLQRSTARASDIGVVGTPTDRLIGLCLRLGTGRYLTGAAARDYLDVAVFARHGIEVAWQDYHHPVYPQQHGGFVSHLSVIDLVLNCGPASLDILTSQGVATAI